MESQTSTKQSKYHAEQKDDWEGRTNLCYESKRNQNIYNDVPAISPEVVKSLRLSTHRVSNMLGWTG